MNMAYTLHSLKYIFMCMTFLSNEMCTNSHSTKMNKYEINIVLNVPSPGKLDFSEKRILSSGWKWQAQEHSCRTGQHWQLVFPEQCPASPGRVSNPLLLASAAMRSRSRFWQFVVFGSGISMTTSLLQFYRSLYLSRYSILIAAVSLVMFSSGNAQQLALLTVRHFCEWLFSVIL